MQTVITEITPLTEQDSFYMFDHLKEAYDYPLHKHVELELTLMENCTGVRRVVGDSIETCQQFDLALIGSNLEHAWEQVPGEPLVDVAAGRKVREYVVQFSPDLLGEQFLAKSQMASLQQLLENAKRGIAFELPAIMELYGKITNITTAQPGFYRMLSLLEILYELSLQDNYHLLASKTFANVKNQPESRRVRNVEEYIDQHFQQEIRLKTLSDIAGMTPAAFSRFFRTRTGKTVSDYIIDTRLGYASRLLVDSHTNVAEICYSCGFNNISNFNRIFKKKKGCSPTAFRDNYHKSKIII